MTKWNRRQKLSTECQSFLGRQRRAHIQWNPFEANELPKCPVWNILYRQGYHKNSLYRGSPHCWSRHMQIWSNWRKNLSSQCSTRADYRSDAQKQESWSIKQEKFEPTYTADWFYTSSYLTSLLVLCTCTKKLVKFLLDKLPFQQLADKLVKEKLSNSETCLCEWTESSTWHVFM